MKKKIVYCYGVWDLFHIGHLNIIESCKMYGNYLIVGVVVDKAVQKLKGKDRPIVNSSSRARLINQLKSVDKVLLQEQFKPSKTIEDFYEETGIKPDILVLGEDQKHLSEKDKTYLIKKFKLEIKTLPRTFGISTSDIIRKIKGEK